MKGFGEKAKPRKKLNYQISKLKYQQIVNEAFKCHSEGNIHEAKKYYQYLIKEGIQNADVFNNYGVILKEIGQYKEAEICFRKSIEINPKDDKSYANLGGILKELDQFEEAELYIRKSIIMNPKNEIAYLNLGSILMKNQYIKEAEISINKAIELCPDLSEAYSILSLILVEDNRLEEAKLSAYKAIKLNPKNHEAHSNLGIILIELGELNEAELSIRKAIEIDPNVAICYKNLSLLNYAKGNTYDALKNIEKANTIDPLALDNKLLLTIFNQRKYMKINNSKDEKDNELSNEKCINYPIILNKAVDKNLIKCLYNIKSLDLNRFTDPSFGKARGSDYKLFQDNQSITEDLKQDLVSITQKIFNSDVFFRDSFFTILEGDSIIKKHNHIGGLDLFPNLNLWKQKYSLVYYLSIGDQDCKYPGSLKFYEDKNSIKSNSEILPTEGMIIIFPADRYHSVKYDGNKDRVIIGVNFYCI